MNGVFHDYTIYRKYYYSNVTEADFEGNKYFKKLTENNVVIMGRKTWDSLPKKPLPNRINYVITKEARISNSDVAFFDINCIKITMLKQNDFDYFIIGGG